jgi:hypothetical protein
MNMEQGKQASKSVRAGKDRNSNRSRRNTRENGGEAPCGCARAWAIAPHFFGKLQIAPSALKSSLLQMDYYLQPFCA